MAANFEIISVVVGIRCCVSHGGGQLFLRMELLRFRNVRLGQ
jgi:tRNA threonylcarbamoyladenosine modification (KEOPS) complex Cgi121 subunit